MILRALKRMVAGTAFEPLARKVYSSVSGDPNARYDSQTLEVMKRVLREDSTCVDVGCHEGAIFQHMLRLAPKGRHLAFEPIPQLHAELVARYRVLESIQVINVALSDQQGQATFQHVVSNPGYSGLRRRSYDRPDEHVVEIVVKTDLLDNIIEPDCDVNFMKVDVEGAELQVFRGAVNTIGRWRPVIVFEHGLGAADHYGTRPEDLFDVLVDQCGLRISLMSDWLKTSDLGLTKKRFSEQFWQQQNYYFIAHP